MVETQATEHRAHLIATLLRYSQHGFFEAGCRVTREFIRFLGSLCVLTAGQSPANAGKRYGLDPGPDRSLVNKFTV